MTTMLKRNYKHVALVIICLATVVSALWISIAVFTDRVNQTSTIQVSSFDDSGYSIERAAPDGYLVAGETAEIRLTEINPQEGNLDSQISITSIWNSPVPEYYPWGNSTSDNAKITYEVDGRTYEVQYTVNKDHSISFALPKHTINKDSTQESMLKFKLPDQLAATGNLTFTFNDITLSGGGWSNGYDSNELTKLHFSFDMAWNISKAQTDTNGNRNKDVLAVIYKPDGAAANQFGLHVIKNGQDLNTNKGKMMDWDAAGRTPWSSYSLAELIFDEKITSIGDFAFADESKITEVVLPNTMEMIGASAFESSGLTGTVTIPASVNMIEALAFGNLPNVTEFTFEHTQSDIIDLPDNQTAGLNKNGAFYVESYVRTKVNASNASILVDYSWVNDNRAKVGIKELVLSYKDVSVGGTQDPTLNILPDNYDAYQKIEYKIQSGSTYISIDQTTGSVTGLKEGTASVQVTIIDANGNSISQTAPVKVYQLVPMLAPQNTWFTKGGTTISQTAITSINFMDSYSPTTYVKKWDASDNSVPGTVTAYLEDDGSGNSTYKLTLAGNGSGTIRANKNSQYAFSNATLSNRFTSVTDITGLSILDTSSVTNMGNMFESCRKLSALDLNSFDTSSATNMSYMFSNCQGLATLDVSKFITSSATNMRNMFNNCQNITTLDVSNFDTSSVTDMGNMFGSCTELTTLDLSNFDTSSVTKMNGMFGSSRNLAILNLSNFNTSSVTKMHGMFYMCDSLKTLNLSNFDTSSVTDMSNMFYGCNLLTTLNVSSFDTSAVTNMHNMFNWCAKLTTLDLSSFDTSSVTDMSNMFEDCSSLTKLDVSNFDTTSITTANGLASFAATCENLTEIKFSENFGQELNIPDPGSQSGMFYVNRSASNPLRTKVIGANDAILAYDWTTDIRGYSIKVSTVDGGSLTVNPNIAINGKTINIAAKADSGVTFDGATINYTDESGGDQSFELDADVTTFIMPVGDITITPKWERTIPMLSSQYTWYTKGGTTISKSAITSINFKDTYSPTTYVEKWDASDSSVPGTVTAYLENDGSGKNTYKLTLAGNGAGTIRANKNSQYAFSHASSSNQFTSVTAITGLSMFDTSSVTDMSYMFSGCKVLASLDVSHFNTSSVTTMRSMFSECRGLTSLDLSSFETASVRNMSNMFSECRVLTSLDVSHFNTSSVTDMSYMFSGCRVLTSLDVSHFNTRSATTMSNMFSECRGLTSLDLSNFDTSLVTNMSYMFNYCSSLITLDTSSFDTSSVTTMQSMFGHLESLTSLDVSGFDTSSVTDMSYMFNLSSNLKSLDLSNFDTSSVTNMSYMFYCCNRLTSLDVSHFDTSSVTNMNRMFLNCQYLTALDVSNFDTSSVTNMSEMFHGLTSVRSLDVSNFDTSSVIYMSSMFSGCQALRSLDLSNFNTSLITNMSNMFRFCTSLTTLDIRSFDTSSATNMSGMFYNCGLTSLDLRHFDTSSVTNMYEMFYSCDNLTTLDLSSFDTSSVTNMREMFYESSRLKTIYASDLWSTENVTSGSNMFMKCSVLKGDISYAADKIGIEYATISGGYLTYKSAPKAAIVQTTEVNITSNNENTMQSGN